MFGPIKRWWGACQRSGSHDDQQRKAAEFDRAAKAARKLESARDIADFAVYVMRNRADYGGNPAAFYHPQLGTRFADVEGQGK
jgi:hypothetical protein